MSLASDNSMRVSNWIIKSIGILNLLGDPTRVKHIFVGDGAEWRLALAESFGREVTRTNSFPEFSSRKEDGRPAGDACRGGGVVRKVKIVGYVNDDAVAHLKVSPSVPPQLKPRRIGHFNIASMLQNVVVKQLLAVERAGMHL